MEVNNLKLVSRQVRKMDFLHANEWENSNFNQGEMDGLVVHWYKNGVKQVEFNYKEGEKDGVEKAWYRNTFRKIFKEGRRISAKVFKPKGEQCSRSNLNNGNGIMVVYNDDGSEKRSLLTKMVFELKLI